MHTSNQLTLASALAILALAATCPAQDTSLHDILIEGEDWQEAVTGQAFTDGLAADDAGNLIFTDVKEGKGIYQLDLEGKVTLLHPDLPGVSGVHVGADGRVHACQSRDGRVIVIGKDGSIQERLAGVNPNDLIATSNGTVYFTETSTRRIHAILPDGSTFVADEGNVIRPNGITLSADESSLAVSEHGGQKIWTWQIEADGKLSGGAPYMTMNISPNNAKGEALGDGGTTDVKGRYYFTSESGIQVFDPAGRLAGIIAKPHPDAKIVSVEFAGAGHEWLFVCAGDKIYKRRTSTQGAWRGQP